VSHDTTLIHSIGSIAGGRIDFDARDVRAGGRQDGRQRGHSHHCKIPGAGEREFISIIPLQIRKKSESRPIHAVTYQMQQARTAN
jgi:hypothetical protein